MKKCTRSEFGCCPDGETAAPGPHHSGCPSKFFISAFIDFRKKSPNMLCVFIFEAYTRCGGSVGQNNSTYLKIEPRIPNSSYTVAKL